MSLSQEELNIRQYIPDTYVELALGWWKDYGFRFKISNDRKSKLGDFRWEKRSYKISVNKSLNEWSFLLTYTHEVAHCIAHVKYGPGLKHHGPEWKREFRELLIQLISMGHIPETLVRPLAKYARNPKASTYSDQNLALALRAYDHSQSLNTLRDLEPGSTFLLNNTEYQFISARRTRGLCKNTSNGRRYLISLVAEVEVP